MFRWGTLGWLLVVASILAIATLYLVWVSSRSLQVKIEAEPLGAETTDDTSNPDAAKMVPLNLVIFFLTSTLVIVIAVIVYVSLNRPASGRNEPDKSQSKSTTPDSVKITLEIGQTGLAYDETVSIS